MNQSEKILRVAKYRTSPKAPIAGGLAGGQSSSGGGDPLFSKRVVIVANNSDISGSTSFIDQSSFARAITTGAAGTWSNTTAPVGQITSCSCNGSTSFLDAASSADFNFGSGAWSVEGFFNFNSLAANQDILFGVGSSLDVRIAAGGNIQVFWNGSAIINSASGISTGTWVYIGASCDGAGNIKAFVGGVQTGATATGQPAMVAGNQQPFFGANNTASNNLNGFMASIRFTKGAATDLTQIPTLPMPTS